VRAFVLLVLLVLLACGDNRGDRSPERLPEPIAQPADAQLVDRWFVAMEKQLQTDATAIAQRTFTNLREAQDALTSLTPAAFEPRPEFFKPLFDEVPREQLAQRMSAYAATHTDEMERRGEAMMNRLEPVMKRAFDNVQRARQP
jgi:hypothetical protein